MPVTHNDRMRLFVRSGLYLVTSEELSAGRSTPDVVRMALRGGVRLIQLREKNLSCRALTRLAAEVRDLTAAAGALLIINDRLDVALATGADGVHLGQDDLPVDRARAIAPDLIIGASTHSTGEAEDAQRMGASYVNIGPLFPTGTKAWDREFLGIEGLRRIAQCVRIPFTVMGGIKREHIPDLIRAGARTIALVTAVTASSSPEESTRELLALIGEDAGVRESLPSLRPKAGD
jgi:thiamine-phosphate pyrophosphorylase